MDLISLSVPPKSGPCRSKIQFPPETGNTPAGDQVAFGCNMSTNPNSAWMLQRKRFAPTSTQVLLYAVCTNAKVLIMTKRMIRDKGLLITIQINKCKGKEDGIRILRNKLESDGRNKAAEEKKKH